MTGERRRVVLAALLWTVFALILWNVIFDYGVRMAAVRYFAARSAFLNGHGPRIEMAPAMHDGVVYSLCRATLVAAPCGLVAGALIVHALRKRE
jgi:hypothetical protein